MEEQYQTISRRLLEEIEAGRFKKGELLPTRTEMAARFNVARATVDRAVSLLVKRGVLSSARGSGTIVTDKGRNYRIAFVGSERCLPSRRRLPAHCKIEAISYERLESKSSRLELKAFDGVIWSFPSEQHLDWMRGVPASISQIVVNRHLDEFNFVSTDHRGAIRAISSERLAECPEGLPVFLRGGPAVSSFVMDMRAEGFIDACRAAGRFYETLDLPEPFEEKLAFLEARFPAPLKRPLIMVSSYLAATGAVMAWAREKGFAWRKDLFYSDFDNDYPVDVWGVSVTSFLQDYEALGAESIERLVELIDGSVEEVKILVQPKRFSGQT